MYGEEKKLYWMFRNMVRMRCNYIRVHVWIILLEIARCALCAALILLFTPHVLRFLSDFGTPNLR